MRDGAPESGKHAGPASRIKSAHPASASAPSAALPSSDRLKSPTSTAGTSPKLRSHATASVTTV
eukprot:9404992-Lingulodinium_polyedra.AAC.1